MYRVHYYDVDSLCVKELELDQTLFFSLPYDKEKKKQPCHAKLFNAPFILTYTSLANFFFKSAYM